ncbi:MAG: hypothetical protein QM790_11290 [Nibricoccus sp.]
MHLSFRNAQVADLAPCFRDLGEAFAYAPEQREKVPQLWAQWLQQGVMTAHVIERHHKGGVTAEAFSAVVFLRDGFVENFLKRGEPYLRKEVVRQTLAGHSVVLTPEQMRQQNREGGLTLLFLNDPRGRRGMDDEHYRLIDTKWSESLYELCGCNLKTIWHEVFGPKVMAHVVGCGLRLREDWAGYWKARGSMPPEDERPFLMGVTREEAKLAPGTHASFLFTNIKSQFGFSLRQQELLATALEGSTDDELAGQLNVSSSAVKKRWISIYENVSGALPGWLEAADGNNSRGSEKRRHLLNYLRQHPEELHPASASRD